MCMQVVVWGFFVCLFVLFVCLFSRNVIIIGVEKLNHCSSQGQV